MNLKPVLAILFALSLSVVAVSQTSPPKQSPSDLTNEKLAKLDLLIKLVPLALQKDQYPSLLLGMENALQVEADTLKQEDTDLRILDPTLSDVDQNAIEKGIYPPRAIQDQVNDTLQNMRSRRTLAKVKMVNMIWDQIKTKLNDGQIKVMAGSFSDQFINPGAKPGELTQDIKVRFFITQVFLDPLAYDLLREMAKHAS